MSEDVEHPSSEALIRFFDPFLRLNQKWADRLLVSNEPRDGFRQFVYLTRYLMPRISTFEATLRMPCLRP